MDQETTEDRFAIKTEYVNKMAIKIYDQNVGAGWWNDPNRCMLTVIQLINTEVCEATEGVRKDLTDSHLPHRKNEEVELADALIRTLDVGGRCSLTYRPTTVVDDMEDEFVANIEDPAALHFLISSCVIGFGCGFLKTIDVKPDEEMYSMLIDTILIVGRLQQYDLKSTLEEKIEYNKTRLDHDRKEREKPHGKKF